MKDKKISSKDFTFYHHIWPDALRASKKIGHFGRMLPEPLRDVAEIPQRCDEVELKLYANSDQEVIVNVKDLTGKPIPLDDEKKPATFVGDIKYRWRVKVTMPSGERTFEMTPPFCYIVDVQKRVLKILNEQAA